MPLALGGGGGGGGGGGEMGNTVLVRTGSAGADLPSLVWVTRASKLLRVCPGERADSGMFWGRGRREGHSHHK